LGLVILKITCIHSFAEPLQHQHCIRAHSSGPPYMVSSELSAFHIRKALSSEV